MPQKIIVLTILLALAHPAHAALKPHEVHRVATVCQEAWGNNPVACTVNWRKALEVTRLLNAFLMDHGFKILTEDSRAIYAKRPGIGDTPLHVAAEKKLINIVRLLLEYHATVHATNALGETPLHQCARHTNTETASLLLAHGADCTARDRSGITPLHCAANENNAVMIAFLLQHGADVNARDNEGRTPLHWAARKERPQAAKILLEHGANVNDTDKKNLTPLHYVFGRQHINDPALALMLIKQGANVNISNSGYTTPLHHAARQGQAVIASALLERGASTNATDIRGKTPLDIAIKRDNTAIIALLRCHTEEPILNTFLHEHGFPTLDHDSNVMHTKDRRRLTPLHHAALDDRTDIARTLIKRGADVNARDGEGRTPLHIAISRNNTNTVRLLLATPNTDVNARSRDNETPLRYAQRFLLDEIASLLRAYGATE